MIALFLLYYAALGVGAFVLDWDEPTFIMAAFIGGAVLLAIGRTVRGAW